MQAVFALEYRGQIFFYFFKKSVDKHARKMYYIPCQSRRALTNTNEENAEIAQLVEHHLAKVGVASSSLVFRSILCFAFLA